MVYWKIIFCKRPHRERTVEFDGSEKSSEQQEHIVEMILDKEQDGLLKNFLW